MFYKYKGSYENPKNIQVGTSKFIILGEGEYICPVCTIFGLEDDEVQILIDSGLRMTDHNIDDEGYEVEISAFKVSKNVS